MKSAEFLLPERSALIQNSSPHKCSRHFYRNF
jgi:hypothetical protein